MGKTTIPLLGAVFLLYSNIPVILYQKTGVPMVIAGSYIFLFFVPLANDIFFLDKKLIFDRVFGFMWAFFGVATIASFSAKDQVVALTWLGTYLSEGMLVYFLVVNTVRNLDTLKAVIWILLFTCALLGTLSIVQDVTKSYDNDYFGLAQRKQEIEDEADLVAALDRTTIGSKDRVAGPVDGPNRYAQIMLAVLPFAMAMYLGERLLKRRLVALLAGTLIIAGVLLSYSRGAFVGLVVMLFGMMLVRQVNKQVVIGGLAAVLLVMLVAAPGYVSRLETLRSVMNLVSGTATNSPEAVIRGRTTEMLAALNVFLDYPILGVGPGQYAPYYSEQYHLDPDIALRHLPKPRRAHDLYAELAAETGLVGLAVFLAINAYVLYMLWRLFRMIHADRPDMGNILIGLLFSIVGYLTTALFLHLSYQRYYWFLLGLCGAAIQICRAELLRNEQV